MAEEELRNAVLVAFANKCDMLDAVGTAELVDLLGLQKLRAREWFIISCCAVNGDGLVEGLDWLANKIREWP